MELINPMEAFGTVVIGNGTYPTHHAPLSVVEQAQHIVCCDGAIDKFNKHSDREPDLIIGDGDSISKESRIKYAHKIITFDEQEYNDQTKAVTYLNNHGVHEISIVAATGGCEDHTLGNISLLVDYMQLGMNVNMFTDYGVFLPLSNGTKLQLNKNQKISIFNFSCLHLTAIGVAFPLRAFSNWWQGTLNRATNDMIEIDADGNYLIFLSY